MPTSALHLLNHAEARLAHAGCQAPQGDAYLLLAHAMGISPETLLSNPVAIAPDDAVDRFQAAVVRRANREPTQYITGSCAFRGLRLAVDERVLVPRIESEVLVEASVRLPHAARLVDVGTGSGAVALAVKNERPDLRVTATDISEPALEVAEANGARLGIDISWRQGDLLTDLPDAFDAVLANIPYYPCELRAPLSPELMDYEPSLAIFTVSDGLALIRELVAQVAARSEVQMVALEIALGQGEAVSKLLSDAGFASVERKSDLTGNERTVVATKNGR